MDKSNKNKSNQLYINYTFSETESQYSNTINNESNEEQLLKKNIELLEQQKNNLNALINIKNNIINELENKPFKKNTAEIILQNKIQKTRKRELEKNNQKEKLNAQKEIYLLNKIKKAYQKKNNDNNINNNNSINYEVCNTTSGFDRKQKIFEKDEEYKPVLTTSGNELIHLSKLGNIYVKSLNMKEINKNVIFDREKLPYPKIVRKKICLNLYSK